MGKHRKPTFEVSLDLAEDFDKPEDALDYLRIKEATKEVVEEVLAYEEDFIPWEV